MRKNCTLLVVLLLTLSVSTLAQSDTYVSYQAFYDDLAAYGQWVSDAQYGDVWAPNVDDDFRPYFTSGRWVMTEYGNTWVSDYPWGWACFHYGRWVYSDFYGWVWVPGTDWGPGWVAWRWGDDYCGWAPLYPDVEWAGGSYGCPDDWWIFIRPRFLYWHYYHNRWREDFLHGPRHTRKLIERTHEVGNTFAAGGKTYFAGPRAAEIQQLTHQPVKVYEVYQIGAGVHTHELMGDRYINTYHPARIEKLTQDGRVPAPSKVVTGSQPINEPAPLNHNWSTPRQFKTDMQQQNPAWNRQFIRNAPPYYDNRPATPVVRPNRATMPGLPHNAPVPAPARHIRTR